jgi:hypothetical protein
MNAVGSSVASSSSSILNNNIGFDSNLQTNHSQLTTDLWSPVTFNSFQSINESPIKKEEDDEEKSMNLLLNGKL